MAIGIKKVIKRKPGSSSKNYFTNETEESVIAFRKEENLKKKQKIFTEEIMPAFNSLVDNLINVYKFQVNYESNKDLRTECVEFLYTVVSKFDPSKGSKAFSYFNIIAKRWLTIKSKTNAKNIQVFLSVDNKEAFTARELEIIENYNFIPAIDEVETPEEIQEEIKKLIEKLKEKSNTENEKKCVDAISTLFSGIDDLEIVNKRAIMLYIREMTHLSPKQLSVVLSMVKKYYKEVSKEKYKSII